MAVSYLQHVQICRCLCAFPQTKKASCELGGKVYLSNISLWRFRILFHSSNMITTTHPHKATMKIPRKQPAQTKAQIRHAFTEFSLLHETIQTEYGHEIDVVTGQTAKTVFLKRLGGAGADPLQAAMFQQIGAPNEFLQMEQEEQDRLRDIAKEVAESPDVLLCHSDIVEALVDGPIEDELDPVAIAFHAFLFQECSWTLTAMGDYDDSFELGERGMFVLVRDVNSPSLQRFNEEIERVEGEGSFTLSTPLEENGTNPRDTSSWRSYKNTPWPPSDIDTDESEAVGWTVGWPHVCNGNPAYKTLMHRLDEMNDYKNRLRTEIGHLTNGTLNNPSSSNEE